MKMIIASALVFLAACSSSPSKPNATADQALPQTLEAAVNSDLRTPENKIRDQYRHPQQTLEFFGLKPNMTVVEIWPGGGWYTEILAPYLAKSGHYIASAPNKGHGSEELAKWMAAHPGIAATVTHSKFDPPDSAHIAPDGTVDMVLTFRNLHNWMSKKGEKEAFAAFFKALKPGGILGFVEHRADPKKKSNSDSGYVKEKEVIKLAKKAGFQLVAKSEINANPKDTKDYPEGVWTLPPVNRHEAADNAKYLAIGESDRMTLKFMKPMK